jgi:hypothetical protein
MNTNLSLNNFKFFTFSAFGSAKCHVLINIVHLEEYSIIISPLFSQVFLLTVLFGLWHGLVLLPVILSILGPLDSVPTSPSPVLSASSVITSASSNHSTFTQGHDNPNFTAGNIFSLLSLKFATLFITGKDYEFFYIRHF